MAEMPTQASSWYRRNVRWLAPTVAAILLVGYLVVRPNPGENAARKKYGTLDVMKTPPPTGVLVGTNARGSGGFSFAAFEPGMINVYATHADIDAIADWYIQR